MSANVALDGAQLRGAFPTLQQEVNGKALVYLDNAATTQKPQVVIEALDTYYRRDNANVHRGVHALSQRATQGQDEARRTVQSFLGAAHAKECIFTAGTTEGINLVAQAYGPTVVGAGDEILITAMEHHSNIVPWQMLCARMGATLRVADMDDRGQLVVEDFRAKLSDRTRIVALVHVSNALGTVNPAKSLISMAHDAGARVLVDGAQAAPHLPIDVVDLDCDFYALSGHKVYGPTGIGVLYGKEEILSAMPPWQGGGDMIRTVSFSGTTYAELPARLEAGTPHIAGAIGLGCALQYLMDLGLDRIAAHEADLLAYGTELLGQVPGLRMVGTAEEKAGVLGFVLDGAHPHDIGTILDHEGIAIRAGHHCAQPVMEFFGVSATARASLALYNTRDDLDRLVGALGTVREIFG